MRDYELTFVLDADLESKRKTALLSKIEKWLKEIGKIEKKENWGKKELAYPIAKKNFGDYFFYKAALPEGKIKELDAKIRLEEKILRHLIIKV